MSRPGDWRCPGCNNHNFKFRMECNRCQASKPEGASVEFSKSKARPGDWTCCGCANRNFAFRDVCNRCELPRVATQSLFSASLLDDEEDICTGMGLVLLQIDEDTDVSLAPASPVLSGRDRANTSGSELSTNSDSSDTQLQGQQTWYCTFCWSGNDDTCRDKCGSCHAIQQNKRSVYTKIQDVTHANDKHEPTMSFQRVCDYVAENATKQPVDTKTATAENVSRLGSSWNILAVPWSQPTIIPAVKN
eukprot:m.196014 g.196014  ORF g.196014 m.196014 type:complete len:247 (-) comp32597_c0_seq1:607-1347(-)